MAYNAKIYATKNKTMKATAIGLWYVQIPNIFVVNPFGEVSMSINNLLRFVIIV